MKMMLAVLTAASIIPTAACADPPTESEQYGIDTVGRSAAARLKDNRGMKVRDACQAEVSGLPKDLLAKYNVDEVVTGCVSRNSGEG